MTASQPRTPTLRARLLRQFLTLGVLPVLVVSLAAVALMASVQQTQAEARNRDLALAIRDQVQVQLAMRQRTATLLAAQLRGAPLSDAPFHHALQALVDDDPFVQAAYVVDAQGRVAEAALPVGSGRFASDMVGSDLSGQSHYVRAWNRGEATWSETFLSTLTGQVTAALTIPAMGRSVVIELSLATLSQPLADLARESAVKAIVLDGTGRVIAHPDAKLALQQQNLQNLPIVRRALEGVSATAVASIDGVPQLVHALPVASVGWSVLVMQPVQAVNAPVRQLTTVLLVLLLASMALATLASWWFSRRTGREVVQLAEAAQAVALTDSEPRQLHFSTQEFNQVWLRLRDLFQQVNLRARQTQTAQRDLQAVLDAATEVAVIATDTAGRVTVFNIGAQRMLGRPAIGPTEQVTPMAWHDPAEVAQRATELSRKHGRVIDGFEAFVVEARHGGYEVRDWTFIHADGSRIEVSLAVTAMHSAEGDLKGFLGVAIDVTERRRAASLELSRKSAELANQAKSDFLSRVSHELRSPLNAMLGYAQLIEIDRQNPATPTQRERVQHIQRAGWHLVHLIDDVLDLSRIESGQLRVSLAAVDIAALVRRVQDLIEPQLADLSLTMGVCWIGQTAGPPWLVRADDTRLTQVLLNLLGNAVKYNRPGGRVMLECAQQDSSLLLRVVDSGRGMSGEQLAGLFEPFNRLGMEGSGIQGTGIGLVITKRLVELMQGSLEVSSQAGVGSTFVLRLAQAEQPAVAVLPDATPATADSGAVDGASGPRAHALYIEDNEVNALLMRAVLRQRPNVQLRVASTVAEGLAALRSQRPDVLLLDMHLPDGTGNDVIDAMQADSGLAQVPLVVVSADATRQQIDTTLQRGVHAYITKPINVSEVLSTIDTLLRERPTGA